MKRWLIAALVALGACGAQGGVQPKYAALGQDLNANTTRRQVAPSVSLAGVAERMRGSCEFATTGNSSAGTVQVEVVTASCRRVVTSITLTRQAEGTKLSYHCARSGQGEITVVPMAECQGIVEPFLGDLSSGSASGAPGTPAASGGGAVPSNLFGPSEQPQQKPDDGIRIED